MPKRDDTFILYYLEDMAQYVDNNCPTLYCLSPSTVDIILSALRFCVWPTRWRMDRLDNHTRIEKTFEADALQWGQLAISEVNYDMACDIAEGFDELGNAIVAASPNTGLNAIAASLHEMAGAIQAMVAQSAACCAGGGGGSAGAGPHSPPFDPTEEGAIGEGDPPEGFESWEQYRANKCAVATDIVNNLMASWNRMSTINLVGMTLVSLTPVLIGLLLDPVPGDEIAVIGGVLLATLGLGTVLIDKVIDTLTNHHDDLICALYNATSAANATADFTNAFSDFWTGDGNDALMGYSARTAIAAMTGSSSTNRLFTLETTRVLPEGDCSGCEDAEGGHLVWSRGSGDLTLNGEARTLTSEYDPGNGMHYVRIINESADPCLMVYLEKTGWTGVDQPVFELNEFECDTGIVWEQSWFFMTAPNGHNVYGNIDYPGYISWAANNAFTLDVVLDTPH